MPDFKNKRYWARPPLNYNRDTTGLWQWYEQPLGQALLSEELEELERVLPGLFGYHLLQVGRWARCDAFNSTLINHCMVMVPGAGYSDRAGLLGDPAALPLAAESVDVVILPHVLEWHGDPHQVLREIDRVLVPEGHVVIMGFNPMSLWGLWRALRLGRGPVPWCARFMTIRRTVDWLKLLGFKRVACRRYFFRPPVIHAGVMRHLDFMERLGRRWWPRLGGAYMLVSRKKVVTMTPIRPRWKLRRAVMGAGLIQNNRNGNT